MAKKGKKQRDVFSKALLMGFGLMDLTKEKAEDFMDDLKKERGVTKQESKKMVKKLTKFLEDNKKELNTFLRKEVRSVIDELGLATKADLKKLKKR